jgi:hypothetical protein
MEELVNDELTGGRLAYTLRFSTAQPVWKPAKRKHGPPARLAFPLWPWRSPGALERDIFRGVQNCFRHYRTRRIPGAEK